MANTSITSRRSSSGFGPDMPFEAGQGKRLADFGPDSDAMILLVERAEPICWMAATEIPQSRTTLFCRSCRIRQKGRPGFNRLGGPQRSGDPIGADGRRIGCRRTSLPGDAQPLGRRRVVGESLVLVRPIRRHVRGDAHVQPRKVPRHEDAFTARGRSLTADCARSKSMICSPFTSTFR